MKPSRFDISETSGTYLIPLPLLTFKRNPQKRDFSVLCNGKLDQLKLLALTFINLTSSSYLIPVSLHCKKESNMRSKLPYKLPHI